MSRSEVRAEFPSACPLARLSSIMCVVVGVGGVLAEVALAWIWLSPSLVETLVAPRLGLSGYSIALDGVSRLCGFAVSMAPMAVLLFLLHQAFQLFRAYRVGDVFTAKAPVRLRRIGVAMLALAMLRPISATLLGVLLTLGNPPGQSVVAITLSLDDYMIAAFGGLVLAIGHVMVEANRVVREHQQIV